MIGAIVTLQWNIYTVIYNGKLFYNSVEVYMLYDNNIHCFSEITNKNN